MNAEPSRVLLIDDERRMLFGLETTMKRAGYDVHSASNGAEGLDLAQELAPDIIVCDVMMPPPDGFELRDLLAEDPETADIPFIFLTARTDPTDRLEGLRAGADDYVTKPFERQELLARVEAVLRRHAIGREVGRAELQDEIVAMQQAISMNVSHELKTPLANILLSLEAALDHHYADDLDQQRKFLEIARGNAFRLRHLIRDLVFLTQLDRDEVLAVRQKVVLTYDFRHQIEECAKRYENRDLDIQVDVAPDMQVAAYRDGFAQATYHLVDNACKFSPDGGRIRVQLEPTGHGGCFLTVEDEGPGIPPDLREKVFERYYQISTGDDRLYGGLGVGLTISRAFARAHGGDVKILNTDDGCSVQMSIPPALPVFPSDAEGFRSKVPGG